MKKLSVLFLLTLALAASTALAATPLTPGNVVVLRCAGTSTGGNNGVLLEYSPSGTLVQNIPFTSGGNQAIVFGSSATLVHDITQSADGALVIIPGYSLFAASIEGTTAASDPRVMAMLKWDGTVSYYTNSAFASSASVRGATSDGFGNFWGVITSGMRYLTTSAPGTSTTVIGTGSRGCAIFNGQLYASTGSTINSVSPNVPTGSASYNAYISGIPNANVYGFALPPGPTIGSKAYVGNYSGSPTAIYAYNWDGSSWSLAYTLTFSGIGNPQHIAVNYGQSPPVIYFTTSTASNNGLYSIVDPGVSGTYTPTTVATVSGGAVLRSVAMAPTQPAVPVFTTMPGNTTAFYGGTATFGQVVATGANPNAWTWQLGSITLTNGNNGRSSTVSGATSDTLTISGVTAADVGSYYAVASNNGGSATSTPAATLTLLGPCFTPPVSITNVAGTTANFSVNFSGCAAPIQSMAWSMNGGGLSDGTTGTGSIISGSQTNSLTIAGVQDGDAGTYTMNLYDFNGALSSASATLTVLDTPGITQQPGNQNKVAGTTASFKVTATGGSLYYNWFKSPSTTPLTNGPSGNGSTISGSTSSNLVITSVQPGDAGTYSVTVTNLAGSTPSDPATLTVGVLPAVTLSDSMSVVGSDAVFPALVTAGTSPFTYTWRHNGTVIASDGFHIFGADTATLGITNVDIPDQRLYALSVSNAYGGVTVSAYLYVIINTNQPNDVSDLIIYEPFDYPTGPNPALSFYSWENLISIYNRITGQPAYWINTGGGLYAGVGAWDAYYLYGDSGATTGVICRNGGGLPVGVGGGGRFPYPGLDCSTRNYWFFSSSGCNNHLHFGGVSSGSVYFSLIFFGDQGGIVTGGSYDVAAGFTSGNSDGTGVNANTFAYALATQADPTPGGQTNPGNVDGPGGWYFGVFKGGGINISGASVNGQWATNFCWRAHPYFIVGCYKIVSGGTATNDDVLSLWVEPPLSSFGADEANVPPPSAGGMTTNWNANAPITEFSIRASLSTQPFSKRISDVRIGKTWASVTKPHYPTLDHAYASPNATFSWPAKDSFGGYGYKLQTSPDLSNWSFDPSTPGLDGTGMTNIVTETPTTNQFWRLDYPARSGAYWYY